MLSNSGGMKKPSRIALLFILLTFLVIPLHAADVSDLSYDASGDTITITDCDTGASGTLIIPGTIGGKPVTSIGEDAFFECEFLTSITIPEGVTSIGDWAFDECYALRTVTIPDSVTSIGDWAFYCCEDLTSIIIPDSVTSIGEGAFSKCSALTTIEVGAGNVNYTDVDGVLFNTDKTLLHTYPADKTGANYTIPDSVTSIGTSAFRECTSLTNITIPDSVTSIGYAAFRYCTNLNSITIPEGVTSIGNWAFDDCYALRTVTIPDSVTSIGDGAFDECERLNSITIGNGVTSIGYAAFYCCNNLSSITIPQSVTSIGENAFDFCINLTSITIPEGVTSIKEKTFLDCWSLTNIIFLGNAPRLGFQAFHQVPANAKVYIYEGASGFSPEDGKFAGFSVVVRKNPFAGDTDKDGWKDEAEVLFGSSPDNAKSVPAFKLKMNVLEGDQLELLFPGEKRARYSVQTSDDMKNWLSLEKLIIGQGNTISERFSISGGLGFYRIQRE